MTRKDIAVAGATAVLAGGVAVTATEVERGTFAKLSLDAMQHVASSMTAAAPDEVTHDRVVPMDIMMVPLINDSGVVTIYQIQLELHAETVKGEERLRTFLPRLNDAFLRDLHAFLPRLAQTKTRPEPAIIAPRLRLIADRAIGAGAVTGVDVKQVVDASRRS